MKIKSIILTSVVALASVGCTDWLDVKPSDRISEEVNFSSESGFRQALNGVYVELNSDYLYGSTLTCEFVDIMAQRYAISAENKTANEISRLQFGGSNVQARIEQIWAKAYNLIANTNLILKNCDAHRDVLSDEYYHVIKGEALALRAYLHFDLFRLFGMPYDGASSSTAIPFYDEFQLDVAPTLNSHDYMAKVISDMKEAEELLKDFDPIVRFGVGGKTGDVFLQYRNLRLNYFAVQALLARAYYYMSLNDADAAAEAYTYARKVIDIQETFFPWVVPTTALSGTSVDHMFSTELMFALQNLNRDNLYSSYFNANSIKETSLLGSRTDVIGEIFDANDYRYRANFAGTVSFGSTNYRVFNKYEGTDSLANQMIPMIRIGEAYLIASELAPDDDERMAIFNTLREHRGLTTIQTVEELEHRDELFSSQLDKEWIRETYGEGQLFYWYKRNRDLYMRSAIDRYNYSAFTVGYMSRYQLPVPDAETKYN